MNSFLQDQQETLEAYAKDAIYQFMLLLEEKKPRKKTRQSEQNSVQQLENNINSNEDHRSIDIATPISTNPIDNNPLNLGKMNALVTSKVQPTFSKNDTDLQIDLTSKYSDNVSTSSAKETPADGHYIKSTTQSVNHGSTSKTSDKFDRTIPKLTRSSTLSSTSSLRLLNQQAEPIISEESAKVYKEKPARVSKETPLDTLSEETAVIDAMPEKDTAPIVAKPKMHLKKSSELSESLAQLRKGMAANLKKHQTRVLPIVETLNDKSAAQITSLTGNTTSIEIPNESKKSSSPDPLKTTIPTSPETATTATRHIPDHSNINSEPKRSPSMQKMQTLEVESEGEDDLLNESMDLDQLSDTACDPIDDKELFKTLITSSSTKATVSQPIANIYMGGSSSFLSTSKQEQAEKEKRQQIKEVREQRAQQVLERKKELEKSKKVDIQKSDKRGIEKARDEGPPMKKRLFPPGIPAINNSKTVNGLVPQVTVTKPKLPISSDALKRQAAISSVLTGSSASLHKVTQLPKVVKVDKPTSIPTPMKSKLKNKLLVTKSPLQKANDNVKNVHLDSSDSDSDASPKKPKPFVPLWARTPNLKRTLTNQVNVDPDQIFSEPPAPNLKEIMKSKYDLARTRAVSGIESGVDLEKMDTLSTQEQLEYKRAMGFF
ncbi:hypothetical protein HDV02_005578 [Globomyces sp. JEL0801]|nr:hypothetical protein HDV02_005578 [Globomyces sp. JEL0801]